MRKILPILFITAGICLMMYPMASEYVYENRADSVIRTYELQTEETGNEKKKEMLEAAYSSNELLLQSQVKLTDPFTVTDVHGENMDYYGILSFDSTGYMGAIEIPDISVKLPIYHGTDAEVLEHGAGHLEGSSLPVGGPGTHAVLSGHTGLNTAKMFTDLTEMEKGDLFFIHILDETLAYKVNDISVVEPSSTDLLAIRTGKDLVTLISCTPYGVNSHRLLVTGERTMYTAGMCEDISKDREDAVSGSLWMKTYKKAVLTGIGTAIAAAVIIWACNKFVKRKEGKQFVWGRRQSR